MRKTCSDVKFIVRYTKRYYTITYQDAVKAAKSCKDGKDDWQQHVRSALYIHIARTRKGVAVVKWRRSVM